MLRKNLTKREKSDFESDLIDVAILEAKNFSISGFSEHILTAVRTADKENTEKLRKAYPKLVEAREKGII